MNNKIIALVTAAVFMIMSAMTAYADINAVVDPDTDYLTVSGSVEEAAGKRMTIEIINPGKTEADTNTVTRENFLEIFSNIKEVTVEKSGKFAITYQMGDVSGFFSIRLRPQGGDAQLYDKVFKYVSDKYESDFLTEYAAASSGGKIDLIYSNAEIIGLNLSDFRNFDSSQKESVIAVAGNSFDSLENFETMFSCAVFTVVLNNADSQTDISSAVNTYRDYLDDNCPVMVLYHDYLDSQSKANLFNAISTKGFISVQSMIEAMGDSIVLEAVAGLKSHSLLRTVLEKSAVWLGDSFTDYFNLADKQSVNSAVSGKRYASAEALCQAVHSAVESASADNDRGGNVSSKPISNGGGSGSVSLPAQSAAAAPEPDVSEPVKVGFDDIADAAWASDAILDLAAKGIVSGIGDSLFEPNRSITRAEFVKIIVGAFFDIDENAIESFDDVADNDWSRPYIATAAKLGIVKGISEREFSPNAIITRQDMTLILYNTAKACGIPLDYDRKSLEFTDASSVAEYAAEAVGVLCACGIINGMGDGSFAPGADATRAQAARLIYSLMQTDGV